MSDISSILGFRFNDMDLIEEALTHGSTLNSAIDYERLEFLGDAILKLVLTEALFLRYPEKTEGELSGLRSVLGSDQLLGRKAAELGLSPFIHVAPHEDHLRYQERILGDVLEALFGAIYLDQGLDTVRSWICQLYANALDGTEDLSELQDYKTTLQERTQAEYLGQPHYSLISESGPVHERMFTFQAEINREELRHVASGTGKSKKQAEQMAAKALLKDLYFI
jgi:ribonuclease-3